VKTVRGEHGKHGENARRVRWGKEERRRKREMKGDHNPFEEVDGDEGKVTGHNPVKCNKKHVNSKEKARNGRGK